MRARPAAVTAALVALAVLQGACTANRATPTTGPASAPATSDQESRNPMSANDSAATGASPAAGQNSARSARPSADPSAGQALLAAAAAGDLAGVRAALQAGAPVETTDQRGRTALLLAVTDDHVEVAKALVAAGASPDAVDDQQDTPWLVTGVTGSVAMAEVLLPANPDLTLRNRYGGVSIIPASERGHVDYVRRVVQTDIDVNHVNNLGWTALLEAVILGDGGPEHQQIVQILLDAGADPAIADRDGTTALQHARSSGYTEIVRILEAAG